MNDLCLHNRQTIPEILERLHDMTEAIWATDGIQDFADVCLRDLPRCIRLESHQDLMESASSFETCVTQNAFGDAHSKNAFHNIWARLFEMPVQPYHEAILLWKVKCVPVLVIPHVALWGSVAIESFSGFHPPQILKLLGDNLRLWSGRRFRLFS